MTGVFKARYPELHGVDWVKQIDPEDRRFFVELGLQAFDYGKMGGQVRAAQAKRDRRGRFARNCDGGNRRSDCPEKDQSRGDQIAMEDNEF